MTEKYNAIDDALTLIGLLSTLPESQPDKSIAVEDILTAETVDDLLELVVSIGSIAAGLTLVVTNGKPQELLAMMAGSQDELREGMYGESEKESDA